MGGVGFEDERRIRTHGSVAGKTPNGRRTQQSASKRTEGDEKVSVDREVQYVFIFFFFSRDAVEKHSGKWQKPIENILVEVQSRIKRRKNEKREFEENVRDETLFDFSHRNDSISNQFD